MPYQLVATQFQVFSLPYSGYFSAFAHATSSLSVSGQYLGLEVGTPIFAMQPSTATLMWQSLHNFPYGALTLYGALFQEASGHYVAIHHPHLPFIAKWDSECPVRLSLVLLTASQLISFPPGTKIFQFPGYG